MSMLTEIAGYLVTAGVCTGIGTDLFILEVPQSPAVCTMIFQYAGDPPGVTFDGAAEDRPSLQVRIRADVNDLATGEARCKSAQTTLHAIANTTIGTTVYQSVQALGSPMWLGNDEQGRPEWVQNYRIVKNP